jgi:hypothetical protein
MLWYSKAWHPAAPHGIVDMQGQALNNFTLLCLTYQAQGDSGYFEMR